MFSVPVSTVKDILTSGSYSFLIYIFACYAQHVSNFAKNCNGKTSKLLELNSEVLT